MLRPTLPTSASPPPALPDLGVYAELQERYEQLQRAYATAEASLAYYQSLHEHAPIAYCTLSPDGAVVHLNQQAERLLERSTEQLRGIVFATLVDPLQRWDFLHSLKQIMTSLLPQTGEVVLRTGYGRTLTVQLEGTTTVTPAGERHYLLALLDITESRQVAEVLAASEQKFRRLFEQSTDAVALMQNEQFIDCNAAVLALLGATDKQQVLGHYPWDLAPYEQRPGVRSSSYFRESVAEALQSGSKRCEGILCRLSGEFMWVEAVLTPVKTDGELLLHVLWRNITAQKQEQHRRQEYEEQLQLALEATGTGVWAWDVATNQVHCNAQARRYFGWPAEETTSVPLDLLQAALSPADGTLLQEALDHACQPGAMLTCTVRVLGPDGSAHPLVLRGIRVSNEFGHQQRIQGIVYPPRADAG
ncbi:PAS domain S-box-containing protein [Hymenobacter luteus]|uniref:PAS domain S-box-containing protein n=2 Tax=Hymenobacter TaxID=89966 RepID=A0A7W9T332_9BACT|nr:MULTISPECIES: PAS domain-containing protein [Hymenobacter]MBB4602786.1 PAS domain S-box-containing protein [Hymenobacter latericoloratus]MBB6060677.1 PAS domain S-box-containing protein [Hymenobacter luteus]